LSLFYFILFSSFVGATQSHWSIIIGWRFFALGREEGEGKGLGLLAEHRHPSQEVGQSCRSAHARFSFVDIGSTAFKEPASRPQQRIPNYSQAQLTC
jgi:hypothetical protein